MRAPLLALLALLLATPFATAQATLGSLEEPHTGTDKLWEITVTPDEADAIRPIVYRNSPRAVFNLTVYNAKGDIVFGQNATRGIQTLPALAAGDYRFYARGTGTFQVASHYYAQRQPEPRLERNLTGADAIVLLLPNWTRVEIEGNVTGDWWDLTSGSSRLVPGANRTAAAGSPYVLTVRGNEGTPYAVLFTPTEAVEPPTPSPTQTPGPALAALVLGLLLAARVRRRAR